MCTHHLILLNNSPELGPNHRSKLGLYIPFEKPGDRIRNSGVFFLYFGKIHMHTSKIIHQIGVIFSHEVASTQCLVLRNVDRKMNRRS